MLLRTVPVLVALLGVLPPGAAEPAGVASVEELLIVLEDEHRFAYELCDETGGYEMGLCGTYERDAAAVRATLQAALGQRAEPSRWKNRKRFSVLRFELGERKVDLWLRKNRRQIDLAFRPALPDCGEDPRLERQGRLQNDPDYTMPERTEYVRPYYPKRARVERADGDVRFLATITAAGRLVDACSLEISPRGQGFETSTVHTLLQWRFEPPTLRGETVAVPEVFSLGWTVH